MNAAMDPELQATMDNNEFEFFQPRANLNAQMGVNSAAGRLEHQLPRDTASMVRESVSSTSRQPFAESSLAKVRKYINALVSLPMAL